MRNKKFTAMHTNFGAGFTLIELIVVVTVIGILSGILISIINPTRVWNRGRYAKATADMDKFVEAVTIAQLHEDMVLRQITGSSCSECTCRTTDLRNSAGDCYTDWIDARNAVDTATAGQVDLSQIDRDPWGSPYVLNENEGESATSPCVRDIIRTVGPDGLYGTSDDKSITIPFYDCSD